MIITKSPTIYSRGHKVGQFFSSPCNQFAYIPIPKCASTWTTKFFYIGCKWRVSSDLEIIKDLDYKKIVILRDPIDRWLSGVSKYLINNHESKLTILYNKDMLEFLFERVDFDDHTSPQVNYISDLDTDTITFFKFDQNLEKNIKSYTKIKTGLEYEEPLYRNDTMPTDFKYAIQKRLVSFINNNPKYIQHIIDYYKKDIDLFNSVKFYDSK